MFSESVSTALISSETMYAALKPRIMALGETDLLWTRQRLKTTYAQLYLRYEEMNDREPFAFETTSSKKMGGGGSIKRKIYMLMKCYLLQVHNNAPAL